MPNELKYQYTYSPSIYLKTINNNYKYISVAIIEIDPMANSSQNERK